ncbi:MAG: cobalamin-dependent protein [Planctomycetes bacterium]|nr:cobalamin-dependent protein [Planctomycetota bacterium]
MSTQRLMVLVVIPTMENAYHNLQDFVAIQMPMGLLSIAGCIEQSGRGVALIDGDAEQLNFEQTLERIVTLRPDYVGATVMTATMDLTIDFFKQLKARLPGVSVIVGGPHVSALPEQSLSEAPGLDVCVVGEGDETILELLDALDQGREPADVTGIAYRCADKNILRTGPRAPIHNLHTLPLPAYHLINPKLYRSYGWQSWISGHRQPFAVIFTGRGCVGKCNFCAAQSVFGRGVRYFSMEQIKAQLNFFVEKWEIRILHFLDDTFTANRQMVEKICHYLIDKGFHRRLEIMVSSRVDTIHPSTLQKMRHAGVRWICFGVESGNDDMLKRMRKNITVEQIKQAFKAAREAKLFIVGNFMLGNVGETEASARDTLRLACELDYEYSSFAIAIPLPGTKLYEHCLENDIPLPTWNDFGNVNTPPIPLNPQLGVEVLLRLREESVSAFFKRPMYIFRMLWRLNAFFVLRDFIKMYLALRREETEKRF